VIVALLVFGAATAQVDVKSVLDAPWPDCLMKQAVNLSRSPDPADIVARAVMVACQSDEDAERPKTSPPTDEQWQHSRLQMQELVLARVVTQRVIDAETKTK